MGKEVPLISHLMFADVLLLIGKAIKSQMDCVIDTLCQLSDMSGYEMNTEKTCVMFSNNVHRITKAKIMQVSEFRETTNMGKYLGVPLSGKSLKRRDYQYLTEQLKSKLATSKTNQLSFACRVTWRKAFW